ncbi:VOC family protein [Solicola gregarius]|uniref:Glyoxalase/bleomycin resistance/dioxygenase family protein n=1 Tax=Solicola gregarius TaxID=2908642 RepID=A0AA46YLA6_9ACTN|nr:VOC family protein [Solicola gregarius]UYM06720.1 glyoxalase/bleomycin resistance/dioxygenase family protein [Solicola gregarius]
MTDAKIGFGAVVLDCPDARSLADFYSQILDRAVTADSEDDWVDLEGTPTLSFQQIPDYESPAWPDGAPQQFHLDLAVDEFESTHARVVELGATPLDPVEPPRASDTRTFRVYADPAGHPFCLCAC